jgi:hypothetical protein
VEEADRVPDWAAVIPTRNDRPDTLRQLVKSIGPDRVVLVHTDLKSPDVDGCLNVHYEGPVNIQAWWQVGIEAAGTRYVALINDDVVAPSDCVPALVSACVETGSALAHPNALEGGPKGWLFVIDTTQVAPDTGFQWWCGDDDLFQQARHNGGIVSVPVYGVRHLDLGNYGVHPEFQRMIEQDQERYLSKWGNAG